MATLASRAKAFLRNQRRDNPVGDDQDALFNEFIVSLKEQGEKTNEWSEGEWFQAAREFGFDEMELGALMETVAAWGVDE